MLGLDVLDGLLGGPSEVRDEEAAHDAAAATDALCAVDDDAGVGVPERVGEEGGGGGQEARELREGAVLERELEVLEMDAFWEEDAAAHGADDVGDAEGDEGGGAFCCGEV